MLNLKILHIIQYHFTDFHLLYLPLNALTINRKQLMKIAFWRPEYKTGFSKVYE